MSTSVRRWLSRLRRPELRATLAAQVPTQDGRFFGPGTDLAPSEIGLIAICRHHLDQGSGRLKRAAQLAQGLPNLLGSSWHKLFAGHVWLDQEQRPHFGSPHMPDRRQNTNQNRSAEVALNRLMIG
jgi:hypothetical protein